MRSSGWLVLFVALGSIGCAGAELQAQSETIARLQARLASLEHVSEEASSLRTRLEEEQESGEEESD